MAIQDYAERFPEILEAGALPLDLVAADTSARTRQPAPSAALEAGERFGQPTADAVQQSAPSGSEVAEADAVTEERTVVLSSPDARPSEPAPVPRRLGRYEIGEVVGRGGFATVYRAWDPQLRRMVALKVWRTGLFESVEAKRRFLREAQAAAKLRHPTIVPLYEVGQEDGTGYLVSDFVAGPNLAEVLKGNRPAPDQAARWLGCVALALDSAHRMGIIHRDVKPANILLDQDDRPLLLDFGLASLQDAGPTLTREGDLLGTPMDQYEWPDGHLVRG